MGNEVGFLVVADIKLNDIHLFACHVNGVYMVSEGRLVS
jgi:hypothetical protein